MKIFAAAVTVFLAIGCLAGACVAQAAPATAEVASHEVSIYEQATASQAYLVAEAAVRHARAHFGLFPTSAAELCAQLPEGERLPNVWTGRRNLPADELVALPGEIAYRVVRENGVPTGCEIVAMGLDRPLLKVQRQLDASELPALLPLLALAD